MIRITSTMFRWAQLQKVTTQTKRFLGLTLKLGIVPNMTTLGSSYPSKEHVPRRRIVIWLVQGPARETHLSCVVLHSGRFAAARMTRMSMAARSASTI